MLFSCFLFNLFIYSDNSDFEIKYNTTSFGVAAIEISIRYKNKIMKRQIVALQQKLKLFVIEKINTIKIHVDDGFT
ncbi:hypothetical protein CMT87_01280 [Elizabethkingia anophelis]|nr:hypothetical protein CWH99_15860 [Elizabethkingia anophelis]PKR33254.1 hypothetical protein CWI00_18550 [Elizabethkingia anophelis]PRQ78790.1 hypothetical protein CMT60_15780 [Elizabethkingia anophelis]PRQ86593.1 hypothetical protein CMT87_01280 [Elizabethkingia anophelis]PRQ88094.1 hypothetical protein CMT86_06320 [Elizabethkingia anophelis]